MATTRISDANIFDSAQRTARLNRFELSRVQNQVATGKRLESSADDPGAAARIVGLRSALERVDQFDRNIDAGLTQLETAEGSLEDLTDVLIRIRELTVSADIEDGQFDLIREEVQQRFDQLVAIANTRLADRFLFGGFETETAPITQTGVFTDPAPIVAYNGDSGALFLQVDEGSQVQVNVTARELFLGSADGDDIADTGQVNIFDVVQDLINRLDDPATNGRPADSLADLDTAIDQVNEIRGRFGARANRLETGQAALESLRVVVEQQRSLVEDADLVEVITELQSREAAFQAALGVTARIIQPSLLDFLG